MTSGLDTPSAGDQVPLLSPSPRDPDVPPKSHRSRRLQRAGSSSDDDNHNDESHLEHVEKPPRQRPWSTVVLRSLPIAFIMLLVALFYTSFFVYHLSRLLQHEVPPVLRDEDKYKRGVAELVTFHILFLMFLLSYAMAIATPPGTIPATTQWKHDPSVSAGHPVESFLVKEVKKAGGCRYCKWCDSYKPDRCHHCRVCGECVLKMDHHCPWIFNCVGWGNHKYFILVVIYSFTTLLFLSIAQIETLKEALSDPPRPFDELFILVFTETLMVVLSFVVGCFMTFHLWLITSGMTTIEFCEKNFRHGGLRGRVFDGGLVSNLCGVFGYNPLLWLIPIDNRPGDGIHFACKAERLEHSTSQQPSHQHTHDQEVGVDGALPM